MAIVLPVVHLCFSVVCPYVWVVLGVKQTCKQTGRQAGREAGKEADTEVM
jgi:hypothetical protein